MQVTTIGVDLAKNVFQVHGITATEDVVFNKPLRRAQFLSFFSKLEPCLIGMESCSSAHHWARELTALGHEVRLIPPMYVKPYVKRGKSDAIDAEAICEAVTRPTMRFVAIKTVEQQSLLSLHRARDLLVRQRTQLINNLRALVAEFGVFIPRGLARVIGFAEDITLGEVLDLPDIANEVIHNLCEQLMALHKWVRWYEDRLKQVAKEDARVRLLRTIPGVGLGDHCQHWRRASVPQWQGICCLAGFEAGEQVQRRQGEVRTDNQDGRPVFTIVARRRHDIIGPTNTVTPRTCQQVADVFARTQTCSRRHCCHGQQDSPDRLGSAHPHRTLQPPRCSLRRKEQRVSKTREMMVHKSAAKTRTPRRMARA